jgi:hypothetical protein
MTKKYSKSETPSLASGQAWTPKTGNPYRPHLKGAASHVPERNVEAEWATGWHDSVANAKKIAHGARPAKKAPR